MFSRRSWLRRCSVRRVALAVCTASLALAPAAEAFVYWADGVSDKIGRTSPQPTSLGPNPNTDPNWLTVQGTNPGDPCGVAVNATHIFWGDRHSTDGDSIGRASLTNPNGDQNPNFISIPGAPDGQSCGAAISPTCPGAAAPASPCLYYAVDPNTATVNGSIGRADPTTGAAVGPNFPLSIPAAGGGHPCGPSVDSTHVYWKVSNGAPIGRATLDGATVEVAWVTPSGGGAAGGCGTAVDSTYVYAAVSNPSRIVRVNKTTMAIDDNWITSGISLPCGLAIDSNYIYWANQGTKNIMRANLSDGSGVTEIVNLGTGTPCGVAVDSGIPSTPPSLNLSSSAPDPTNTSPIPVTAQFSESVTGFTDADVVAGNATVGNFVAVDGDTYTFDLTPSSQGQVTADVAAGAAQDGDGTQSTAAPQFSRTFDSVAPTVTCSATPATLKSNKHKLVSITTSVTVTDGGSGPVGFKLLAVQSSQGDSGLAADDVPNDIQGWATDTPDTSGQLRSERYGGDRVYTFTYQGSDQAGNTAGCQTTVTIKKGA